MSEVDGPNLAHANGNRPLAPNVAGKEASSSKSRDRSKSASSGQHKRKKLVAACLYCRRSHMICDEGRPCKRCIKRNIAHLCHDEPASMPKKKSKSAVKSDTKLAEQEGPTGPPSDIKRESIDLAGSPAQQEDRPIQGLYKHKPETESVDSVGYTQAQRPQPINPAAAAINQRPFFYSEHAGSEFNSLTEFLSMIDDNDVINSINMSNDPMLRKLETASALGYSGNNSTTNLAGPQFDSTFFLPSAGKSQMSLSNFPMQPQAQQGQQGQQGQQTPQAPQAPQTMQPPQQPPQQPADDVNYQTQPMEDADGTSKSPDLNKPAPYVSEAARDKFFLTAADPTTEISPEERLKQVINAKLEAGLLKPYNYAKGYQRLQNYMDNHMAFSSRQRILKPLSTFRPGFRAVAKTLKDIDLILVEENFERMLLDYDRVFTSMAIPACLWRRTGEIYRGNKEFASLVEVSIDDLKNGHLTIYELMTEESSVNFWEKYGAIAFDKTQKAVLTSCNLRTRDGLRKKNCCFSFTIRRDRYNIPSCIVGNFIPIQ